MADRPVTETCKDSDGDILALCCPNEYWSPRKKADAINDIETRLHTYHVPWKSGRTEIRVVNDPTKGKYLRTDRDDTSRNNLDDLPDCDC
ncbi:MAG: hypothetical protein COV35_03380 [Alphaproteobacteria bacterium CG11_big_fil_rev_8_21_14_0_20_39_49]|nr:MAG: hypothetical protein COV35_03380 [Alphaproteobacteria bacterium CG11_big_fil_rev_8_21_14_0_20_39_49]